MYERVERGGEKGEGGGGEKGSWIRMRRVEN